MPAGIALRAAIARRYPQVGDHGDRLRSAVEGAFERFLDGGLGDNNAGERLASADDDRYWQQLSEVLVSRELLSAGLVPQHASEGPDFLVEHRGRRIWIEVICPSAAGLPASWTGRQLGEVGDLPHEAILLRWTAAIKEKAEKLLGNPALGLRGYVDKSIVLPADVYVIAVNARLLRDGVGFPQLTGISQFPFAVEAAFSVGPMQLHLDPRTLRAAGMDHQHRPLIPKPSGATVPADTFLDPKFAPVAAIWALDVDEASLLGHARPSIVVHNPRATSSLARGLLPAQSEYVAEEHPDHYLLNRTDGRLAPQG